MASAPAPLRAVDEALTSPAAVDPAALLRLLQTARRDAAAAAADDVDPPLDSDEDDADGAASPRSTAGSYGLAPPSWRRLKRMATHSSRGGGGGDEDSDGDDSIAGAKYRGVPPPRLSVYLSRLCSHLHRGASARCA